MSERDCVQMQVRLCERTKYLFMWIFGANSKAFTASEMIESKYTI